MRTILFVFALMVCSKLFACSCGSEYFPSISNKVEKYDFVALISIKKIIDTIYNEEKYRIRGKDTILKVPNSSTAQIHLLETFKGPATLEKISVWGVRSSCEMGVAPGQQWIVFAKEITKGLYQINYCGGNVMFTNSSGEKDWVFKTGILLLDSLRILNDSKDSNIKETHIKYPNGQTEVLQSLKRGLLWGKQKVFYNNGTQYAAYNYKKGKLHGRFETYSRDSFLLSEGVYKNGVLLKRTYWYPQNLSNKNEASQKKSELKYKKDARSYSSTIWSSNGVKESESFYDNEDSSHSYIRYYEDGKIHYMQTEEYKKKQRVYKEWNLEGILIKETTYLDEKITYQYQKK